MTTGHHVWFGSRLCEKSREPRKRRIVFSIAVSRPRLPVQLVSVSMKLRQKFYTRIERRTFHTAWTRGPITTGVTCAHSARHRPKSKIHGVWVPARAALGRDDVEITND